MKSIVLLLILVALTVQSHQDLHISLDQYSIVQKGNFDVNISFSVTNLHHSLPISKNRFELLIKEDRHEMNTNKHQFFLLTVVSLPRDIGPKETVQLRNVMLKSVFPDSAKSFPIGSKQTDLFPKGLKFMLLDNSVNGRVVDSASVPLNPNMFAGILSDLKQFKDFELLKVPQANILEIGMLGSGKSTFVNSMFSTFSDHIRHVAYAYGSTDHSTKEFHTYDLTNSIRLIDTVGIEQSDIYDNKDFISLMLRGMIPTGVDLLDLATYKFNETIKQLNEKYNEMPMSLKLRKQVHAVLLFVTLEITQDPAMLKKCRTIFKIISDYGYNPLIIVTHLDSNMRYNVLTSKINNLTSHFGIPINRILFPKIYVDHVQKNPEIDMSNLLLVHKILQLGNDRLEYLINNEPEVRAMIPEQRKQSEWNILHFTLFTAILSIILISTPFVLKWITSKIGMLKYAAHINLNAYRDIAKRKADKLKLKQQIANAQKNKADNSSQLLEDIDELMNDCKEIQKKLLDCNSVPIFEVENENQVFSDS